MLLKLIICVLLVSHSLAEEEDDGQYSPEKYEKPYEELSNGEIDESQVPETQSSQQSNELNSAVPASYQQPLQQQTVPQAFEQPSQQQHLGLVQSVSQEFNHLSQQRPIVPQTFQQNLQQPIALGQAGQTSFQQQQQSVPQVYQQLVQQQQQQTPLAFSQVNKHPQVYQQPIAVAQTDQKPIQQQSVPQVYQQHVQQLQQQIPLAVPQAYQQNLKPSLGVVQADQKLIQQYQQTVPQDYQQLVQQQQQQIPLAVPQAYQQNLKPSLAVVQADQKLIQQFQQTIPQDYQQLVQQQQKTPLAVPENYQQAQVYHQNHEQSLGVSQSDNKPIQQQLPAAHQLYQQQQQQTPLGDLLNYQQYLQQKPVLPQFYQQHSTVPQIFQTSVQNEKPLSSQIYQQLSQQQSQIQAQKDLITPQSYSQNALQQPLVSTDNNVKSITFGQQPVLQTQVFQQANQPIGSQNPNVYQVNEQPESHPITLQEPAITQTPQQQSVFSQLPITATNYQTDNGHRRNENVDSEGNVVGQYSYIDPNGKTITVKYSAGKDGFKVEGDHLPKAPQPPVVPEAPAAIPQYNPQVVNPQNLPDAITSQINSFGSKVNNQDLNVNTASQQPTASFVSQLGVQSTSSNSVSQPQGLSQNLYSTQTVQPQPQLNLQALYGQVQALPKQLEVPSQYKLQTLYNQQSSYSFNPQSQLKYSSEFQYNPVTNQPLNPSQ